jgi:hypothetical protein
MKPMPGMAPRPKADPDALLRWTASAIRMGKLLPGISVKREMRFVWAIPPRLN